MNVSSTPFRKGAEMVPDDLVNCILQNTCTSEKLFTVLVVSEEAVRRPRPFCGPPPQAARPAAPAAINWIQSIRVRL